MKNIKTELQGRRISIRKLKLSDAGGLYAHIKDKEIARWTFVIPHPYPKDGAVKFIRKQQRLWRAEKAFAFAIILNETERAIGGVDLARVDMKHKCANAGFWIGKKYWNQGLTTEAIKLLLRFGFKELRLHRIYAMAFEANVGSCRVLRKCGFKPEGVMRQALVKYNKRHNLINYGIMKSELEDI